jgi:hypothetical protein
MILIPRKDHPEYILRVIVAKSGCPVFGQSEVNSGAM